MRGDVYGIQLGRLQIYFRTPFQIWWGNKLLVHLRFGLPE